MKKLILCSLITISVAFGVDCNAMIKRYINKPSMLVKNCINNNADACFCSSVVITLLADKSRKSGDYKKADEYSELLIDTLRRACNLGNREACAILDKAGAIK